MKNKKRFALLLCAALLISVLSAGCSEGGTPPASSADPAPGGSSSVSSEENTPPASSGDSAQSGDSSSASSGTAAALGSMKSFTAVTLDGESFTQDDIAAKDVTLINFWSLTCGPCIAEMPDLAAFANALPDNVRLMTVCLDGAGYPDFTRGILADAGFEGVTLIAGDGDLLDVSRNVRSTPSTILVDAEGNLVGDVIIGRQKDLSGTLLTAVNDALTNSGKEAISLEK